MKHILSIQSHVVFGHVGNASAVLPLQRLGHEVWPIHTVQFSNHTGYGEWTGMVLPPDHVLSLMEGLKARGALGHCDALLTGYLGSAALADAALTVLAGIRAERPGALYCCDPVMGDDGRDLFLPQPVAELLRDRAVPCADILTPNRYELSWLTGLPASTLAEVKQAAAALIARGPRLILVTSLPLADGQIGMLLAGREGCWMIATPMLPLARPLNGAGDLTAALFLGTLLAGKAPPDALGHTANAVFSVIEATQQSGERELALVAAQEALAAPPVRFRPEAV